MTLCVGDLAPDFTLPTDDKTVTLGAFRGKPVVVYFYPKDDTPGCTTEACSFRDNLPDFSAFGAEVIGISKDSPGSHAKFRQKHALTFHLASDEDGAVCTAYGVWVEKTNFGKTSMGIERTTFLIDRDGKIARIWNRVKVDGHAAQVLDSVKSLT